jgi:peroxiredoxin
MTVGGSMKLRIKSGTLYSIALHVIVFALSIEVYILMRQNNQLKDSQDPYWAGRLKIGDSFSVDSLIAVDSTKRKALNLRDKHLVFVFSTKCKFCVKSIEVWKTVAARAKTVGTEVYAISLDSLGKTRSYIHENHISFYDVYVPVDVASFARKNRLGGVPLTVLRSERGTVDQLWQGLLAADKIEEVVAQISK